MTLYTQAVLKGAAEAAWDEALTAMSATGSREQCADALLRAAALKAAEVRGFDYTATTLHGYADEMEANRHIDPWMTTRRIRQGGEGNGL